ncbi:MAG TPA: hypothetical protein VFW86_05805, partial [Candidatus Limnocylindrales bacterium]|nr:hypothetical protein [Candidatus Limnocylindrales bacterium]
MTARIAVGVSGAGTNLGALLAADRRGLLGGAIEVVFADRDCPALAVARDAEVRTEIIAPAGDAGA